MKPILGMLLAIGACVVVLIHAPNLRFTALIVLIIVLAVAWGEWRKDRALRSELRRIMSLPYPETDRLTIEWKFAAPESYLLLRGPFEDPIEVFKLGLLELLGRGILVVREHVDIGTYQARTTYFLGAGPRRGLRPRGSLAALYELWENSPSHSNRSGDSSTVVHTSPPGITSRPLAAPAGIPAGPMEERIHQRVTYWSNGEAHIEHREDSVRTPSVEYWQGPGERAESLPDGQGRHWAEVSVSELVSAVQSKYGSLPEMVAVRVRQPLLEQGLYAPERRKGNVSLTEAGQRMRSELEQRMARALRQTLHARSTSRVAQERRLTDEVEAALSTRWLRENPRRALLASLLVVCGASSPTGPTERQLLGGPMSTATTHATDGGPMYLGDPSWSLHNWVMLDSFERSLGSVDAGVTAGGGGDGGGDFGGGGFD